MDNNSKQIFELLGCYWTSHLIEALQPTVLSSSPKNIDQFKAGLIGLFNKQIGTLSTASGLSAYSGEIYSKFGVWKSRLGLEKTIEEFKKTIALCYVPSSAVEIVTEIHLYEIYKKAMIATLNKFVTFIEDPIILKKLMLSTAKTNTTLIRQLVDEYVDISTEVQGIMYRNLNPQYTEGGKDKVTNNMSKMIRALTNELKEAKKENRKLKAKLAMLAEQIQARRPPVQQAPKEPKETEIVSSSRRPRVKPEVAFTSPFGAADEGLQMAIDNAAKSDSDDDDDDSSSSSSSSSDDDSSSDENEEDSSNSD